MKDQAAVRVVGLHRRFGEVEALRGVDLTVPTGSVFALLGPNGAGKTTLIHILTTLLAPDAGVVEVAGHNAVTAPARVRAAIGVTFQETVLDKDLTGREALVLHGRLYGLRGQEVAGRVAELESFMGLGQALDRRVGTYSGGMKRRLELARGLLTRPQVLFLDEPTAGLDPQNRSLLWEQIRRLNREQGITVVLTTHYMEEAEELAQLVAIIDHGRIIAEGTPAQLVADLGDDVIFVRGAGAQAELAAELQRAGVANWTQTGPDGLQVGVRDGGGSLVAVVTAAGRLGYRIEHLGVSRPNLSEVFFKLTGRALRD